MAETSQAAADAPARARAVAKYVHMSPTKVRRVTALVKGRRVAEALDILRYAPQAAATPVYKVIASAAANAENNHDLVGDEMRIASITVDEGPTLRRFRPRALGRATPINKRTSHIAVALVPDEEG